MEIKSEEELRSQRFLSMLMILCSYRTPMKIIESKKFPVYKDTSIYYVCPRCKITLEREFMNFCDRCGQCLDWKGYRKAKVIPNGTIFEK